MSSQRIAPIPTLPLFHRLDGRRVVVVGDSDPARWKAELMAAAGADVVRLTRWTKADLVGAAVAVADLSDHDEAVRFRDAARAAGAAANIIDQTELCDVIFATIVNRSPIMIAISTDGTAPMLGQAIRTRIEALVAPGLARWAEAARGWRPRLKQAQPDFGERRGFWRAFALRAWSEADRAPTEQDFTDLAGGARSPGRVDRFEVDPNDPDQLTLGVARALQRATTIFHDPRITPAVIELARREADRVAIDAGDTLDRRIAECVDRGEQVVWLVARD